MREALRLLEAVLFASPVPVGREALARALEASGLEVDQMIEEYRGQVEGRGFVLQEEEGGLLLLTPPEAAEVVARALEGRTRELSMAVLETLAAVAYFEPVPRPFVDRLRGVRSERSLAVLEEEGLIEEAGRAPGPGRPVLLRTTAEFRRRFGVGGGKTLPELPEDVRRLVDGMRQDGRGQEDASPDVEQKEA